MSGNRIFNCQWKKKKTISRLGKRWLDGCDSPARPMDFSLQRPLLNNSAPLTLSAAHIRQDLHQIPESMQRPLQAPAPGQSVFPLALWPNVDADADVQNVRLGTSSAYGI